MKRGTPRHPKLIDFVNKLDQRPRSIAAAVGHLELLWHFTAEFAPQGDIGKFSDDQIEAAMHWEGRRGKLLRALIDSGWIDERPLSDPLVTPQSATSRLLVHDWHDHCDETTRKRLHRAKLPFLTGQPVREFLSGQRQTTADNGSLPYPTNTKPTPTPRPVAVAAKSEYPKTEAAILSKFQSTDGATVRKIVDAAVQAQISVDHPKIPVPDDGVIAEAVEVAYREAGTKQTSVMLFTRTVPNVIFGWAKHGRASPTKTPSLEQIMGRPLNLPPKGLYD